tara:strand:- start:469 stop:609 length:141 start_codon:yes stop_codon:yes gene_type:complete
MLTFVSGVILGAVITVLVYRNNTALMAKVADRLNKKIASVKDKLEN